MLVVDYVRKIVTFFPGSKAQRIKLLQCSWAGRRQDLVSTQKAPLMPSITQRAYRSQEDDTPRT